VSFRGIRRSLAGLFLCGLALVFVRSLSAEEHQPILHGGSPPPMVRRAALAEALKYLSLCRKDPDSKEMGLHQPTLLSAQRTVDFRRPSEPAWLLLYSVGSAGPRAHTNISQLILVSAKDGRIILKSPEDSESSISRGNSENDQCPDAMDDALLVQIALGRFVLGLSCGTGGRLSGYATIRAVGGQHPFHSMFQLPGEDDPLETRSVIYFVKDQANEPLALVVRQKELIWEANSDPKLVPHEFFYRFNAERYRYERTSFPAEKLTRLIDAAERDQDVLKMIQEGGMAYSNTEPVMKEAAAADRELNSVYRRLRQKLSPDESERLKQDEIDWLARRDAIREIEKRTAFVKQRVEELQNRLGGKPSGNDPTRH
jgi:uncharacterized protein YecT (DUF1311 family)